MRRLVLAAAIIFAASAVQAETEVAPASLSTAPVLAPNSGKKPVVDKQQFAYSIGYMNGQGSAEQIPDLDIDTFIRGFKDAVAKKESLLSAQERTTAINRYKAQRMAQLEADLKALAKENAEKGSVFLAQNKSAEGIQVTTSGLQYRVLKEATGKKPSAKETVKVNYEGAFLDGTVFDSSINRGEPVTFALDQVIAGWTEGLQLMPTGSVYEFFIPAELAYGAEGTGPIPPNAVLNFRIELLNIEKPAAATSTKKKKK
ncbi:MAG: FKBP-type peptidyl-prolyl cis-trans isomerase [Paraperlucidibaca sp.]